VNVIFLLNPLCASGKSNLNSPTFFIPGSSQ
jgi:hypothetical protein